jgi:hypothetical protein
MLLILMVVSITIYSCGCSNTFREMNLDGNYKDGKIVYDNGQFKIHELFTYRDVTVYRFIDGGHSRYFAVDKNGNSSQVESIESTGGKHPVYNDNTVFIPHKTNK